jgi:fumarylacetoacetase
MSDVINETHDPRLKSGVPCNLADSWSFPVQNLPFGRFTTRQHLSPRLGVAIGDFVLDLKEAVLRGLFERRVASLISSCSDGWLNSLMSQDVSLIRELRLALSIMLRGDVVNDRVASCLVKRTEATLHKPVDIRNFSDFFTSIHHAQNSGKLKRPDNPLLPNFHTLPVAYHGRASTVCVDGTPVRRPCGQFLLPGKVHPTFGPTRALDLECELASYVGSGNMLGQPIRLAEAEQRLFGFSILNDWSARDIQNWESTPLGPFLAKSFQSTVSPWVVTLEALAPFRVAPASRTPDAPRMLTYLHDTNDRARGGLDIQFEVSILSDLMKNKKLAPHPIAKPKFRDQYWTVFQMLAHQTSNGCTVIPGDLLGSGTVSGSTEAELGCLLEMTRGGTLPVSLPTGEQRTYLQDGDELSITAGCHKEGFVSIGFGNCRGSIKPAVH